MRIGVCRMRFQMQRAVTLVEVIVVAAIIGMLAAILIPAVHQSREATRRTECANRLRQIGVALNSHVGATGKFPAPMPARAFSSGRRWSSSTMVSGYYDILPYMEQMVLYNAINTGYARAAAIEAFDYNSAVNVTAATTRLNALVCPSDSAIQTALSPASFRFNVGSSNPSVPGSGLPKGAFDPVTPASPSELPDGLSNTVGFSERVLGSQHRSSFDRTRDMWGAGVVGLFPVGSDDQILSICRSLQGLPLVYSTTLGGSWLAGGSMWIWYNHVAGPNDNSQDCIAGEMNSTQPDYCEHCSIASRSMHSGGVHCLMMDGSTHFKKSSINLRVWRALGTRAGGEPVSSE